jgi:outer membrane autotransporter protein
MDRSKTMRELDTGLGLVEAREPALEASGRISRRRWMVSKILGVIRSAIDPICAVFKSPFIGVLLGFCLCGGEGYGQQQLWNGPQTSFGDGSTHGGDGTWDNDTTNWLNVPPVGPPTLSQSWLNGVADFESNPGTVTLGADITFQGMRFGSDGYAVVGAGGFALMPVGMAIVSTDPGITATISAPINGTGGLDKEDPGTLILSGTNAYSGGTTVGGGILSVGSDTNLRDPAGVITLQNGELLTTADGFSSARAITLAAALGDDALVAATGTTATYTGIISGPAGLTIGDGINAGTVVLTGENTYSSGNTLIKGLSTLQIGNGGTTGSIIGNVTDNGNLFFNRSDVVTFSGNISGAGTLTQSGSGTVTLSGDNSYTGGTRVSGGILSVGSDPNLGDASGGIALNGGELLTTGNFTSARTLTLAPSAGANTLASLANFTVTYNGLISGSGGLVVGDPVGTATGTVDLANAANSYTGGTTVSAGTLRVAVDGNLGDINGGITLNGGQVEITGTGFSTLRPVVLMPNGGNLAAVAGGLADFEGVITGSGPLTIGDTVHTGTVELGGTNTYTGSTTVLNGVTLLALSTGALSSGSAFVVNGTLDLNGFSSEIGSLAGSGTVTNGDSIAVVLTAGGNDTDTAFSGVLQDGTHTLALIKTGTGTLALTGTDTYTGGTTISGGTLEIGLGDATGSIVGDVIDNATLRFNRSDTITFAGNISGTGGLTKAGLGTLILTGTNSYGGGTTIEDGTLQIGDGFLAGSILGDVLDNGSLVFDRPDGVTFGGVISGTGKLTQSGGSPLILTGTNTYTGGTTITTGRTLDIGDGGTAGSIVGNVVDNGLLTFNRSDALTFSGVVSGSGVLIQEGSGILILTGSNTYNGGTRVEGGILSVASDAQLGASGGAITLQGGELLTSDSGFATTRSVLLNESTGANTLAAMDETIATYNGVVSDGGNEIALVIGDPTNQGTVVLTRVNTYSGGTIVAGGRLSVASDPNLGALTGGLTLSGGALETTANFTSARSVSVLPGLGRSSLFADFNTVANYTGFISGPGLLSVDGPGTVVLSGINNYSGGTLTQNGILSVATDANLGDPTGAIIVEAGELLTTGDGFISGRAVAVNPGQGADTLAAATGTRATYTGIVSGDGTLVIGDATNAGTVVLGGINTYSGGTVINLGTLLVDSAQALGTGDVTVNGGVLAADPQPINVLGNYTQNAGGTLQLSVAGANPGQYDTLAVMGNAALNGTLQLISLGFHPVAGNQLGLIATGGIVSGRFTHFVDPFVVGPTFNTINLVYGRNSVVLKFLNSTTPISPVVPIVPTTPTTPGVPPVVISTIDFQSFTTGLAPNGGTAAGLLDQVELDPRAAGVIGFMFKEPETNFLADFSKISPDVLSSLYEIGFSNSNIQRLNLEDRLDAVRNGSNGFSSNMNLGGPKVYLEVDGSVDDGKADKNPVQPVMQPSRENRWGVWVSGFGDFVNVDGDGNGKGYDFTTGGVTVGIDFRITDNLVVGLMGNYSHTWSNLKPGHLEVNSGRGGLYASWFERGFYLDGAIYGGGNSIDTARSGLGGLASGGTDGSEWSAFLSAGYDFHIGRLTVGPIAALQYTEVNIDGFSEKGSAAPMAIHEGSAESLRSDIGFRAFYQWQIGKVILEPSLKATWEHEYKYSALPITAGFAGVPGPSGTFFGPNEGHDSAVVDAGVTVQWTPTLSTYINYDGQLGRDRYGSNAVTGGVKVAF